jgi:hypothetical protein
MDKNGVVIFKDWNDGQVKHPIYGFGLLQNVEVFENKGIAKLKNRQTLDTSISPTQLPIAEVKDIYGNTYTLTGATGSGSFYKNGILIQAGLNNASDLVIYKNYVWVSYSTNLSCYGPLNNAPQWFPNISSSLTDLYNHKMVVGQDDYLYIGNANYVAKIQVTASGTPAVAPSITPTLSALDLPDGQYVTTLCEYGKNIMIGTQGGATYGERGNYTTARIYPWNRQAGTLGNPGLADLPIIFSENGINAMVQHANKLYVQAGTQGNVYVTDSTNYVHIGTLPYVKSGITSNSTVYANAMAVSAMGNLLIGLSTYGDGYSKGGIYEIDLSDSKYPISYRTISTLSTGTTTVLNIGFVSQFNYQTLHAGWSDAATFGVDTSDFRMYSSYGGVIETQLVAVGAYNSKKTFQHIEWSLAEPLISGQNIRISYRRNSSDAYKLLGTWEFSTLGSVVSYEDTASIEDCQYIQLKIELDQGITTLYGSNIYLVTCKLW